MTALKWRVVRCWRTQNCAGAMLNAGNGLFSVAEVLRAIIAALKDGLPKLSEAGCSRDYGRLVLTLDEMIYEVRRHALTLSHATRRMTMPQTYRRLIDAYKEGTVG